MMLNVPEVTADEIRAGTPAVRSTAAVYQIQEVTGFIPVFMYPSDLAIEELLPGELGFYQGERITEDPDAS